MASDFYYYMTFNWTLLLHAWVYYDMLQEKKKIKQRFWFLLLLKQQMIV